MKILLFGPNGQVGWELQRALAPLGEVLALGRRVREGLAGDLEDPDALQETIRQSAPDVIVNAAAYAAVDHAESEPERAHVINTTAPGVMASEAKSLGSLLVHYSTDYVFDGSGQQPWREDDPTAPLNVYGRTKLAGETAIRAAGGRHLIFRTAWVYAARGNNFIRTMLRLACERDALKVVNDQHGTPTGAEFIADATAHAIRATTADSDRCGTYHLTAAGETTWYGYATYLLEQARQLGYPLRVRRRAIEPVTSEAFPTAAQRPHNSRLDGTRLEKTFGLHRPDWRDGVARAVREMTPTGKVAFLQ